MSINLQAALLTGAACCHLKKCTVVVFKTTRRLNSIKCSENNIKNILY